jgi:hypothetical protein
MSKKSIEKKLTMLEKKIDKYEKLDNHKKISGINNKIKKDIDSCKSMLGEYLEMIDNPDDHIGEVVITKVKDDNSEYEQQFEIYVDKINKIKEEITDNNKLVIDEQIDLYLDLVFAVKWCKEYLRKQNMKVHSL